MRNLHGLLPVGTIALVLTIASLNMPMPARADEGSCEPAKLAAKCPALAGKTIKIGQDGESVPFSQRARSPTASFSWTRA